MTAADQNPWTPEQLGTLRAEWAVGTSAADIGKLIDRSKGSVTGKARRMGLTARPSPIVRRAGQQDSPQPARLKKAPQTASILHTPFSVPEIVSARAIAAPVRMGRTCEWINGQRGAYTKCASPISRGSYCAEHAARCYLGQKVVENAA